MQKLLSLLKKLTLVDIKTIEEKFDEQFKALQYLYKNIKEKESFPILVILNALVSYQLNTTGENYWWEFAKYFSDKKIKDEIEAMKEFLRSSKGNKRYLNVKIKRLEKIKPYIGYIKEGYEEFYEDMIKLRDFLANIMNQNKNAKTIVFSVKMFGYAMRIRTNRFIPYPFEIAIPLDFRIKKITEKFTEEDPIEFWFKVSKETNIPCLHIDSIIWTLYQKEPREIKEYLLEKYQILEEIRKLIL